MARTTTATAAGLNSPLETWREQLRRGGLDLAILLAVSSTPRYGLEIIRYLQESTDLVVMATDAKEGLPRILKGSVAEKVTRVAGVRSLLVPPSLVRR